MSVLISGILLNPTGVAVAGAEITFTALTTSDAVLNGFSASFITNDNGEYAIPLEYGDYAIALQHDGHNTLYGSVSINDKSTPTTINELLKLAMLEQAATPALIVYFRDIQADVTEKLATMQRLNQSATSAANSAILARSEAANYAQDLSTAVTQAQQASTSASVSANTATSAKNAAEIAAANAENTLADAMKKSANGADIVDKAVFRSNLGLGDAALENMSALFRLKGPLGTIDLNDVVGTAYQGIWTQGATANATTARNYPIVSAGSLEVIYNTANNYGTIQKYTTHVNAREFIRWRAISTDSWSAWSEVINSTYPQTITGQKIFQRAGAVFTGRQVADTDANFLVGLSPSDANLWSVGKPDTGLGSRILLANYRSNAHVWLEDTGDIKLRVGGTGNLYRRNQEGTDYSIWDSGNLVKQATVSDTTAGAVMINGGHGVGGSGIQTNDAIQSMANGISRIVRSSATAADNSNWPTSEIAWKGFSVSWDTNAGFMLACNHANTAAATGFYIRNRAGGTNSPWQQIVLSDTNQTIGGTKTFSGDIYGLNNIILPNAKAYYAKNTGGANVAILGLGSSNNTFLGHSSVPLVVNANATPTLSVSNGTPTSFLVQGRNAVADSSGYWKTASPVVKLFTDGTSELTDEAEGITTERISEGVYKITGCLGLNADRAWGGDDGGIDVPVCRNKLPRLWVDYGGDEGSQINEDGSIVIRTYHRTHPDAMPFARNEIEGYNNGDPIDIPSDVFLMVRVQMPKKEPPKPAILHSNVYCNTINGFVPN